MKEWLKYIGILSLINLIWEYFFGTFYSMRSGGGACVPDSKINHLFFLYIISVFITIIFFIVSKEIKKKKYFIYIILTAMFFEFCALYTGRFCSPVVIPNLSSMNSIQLLLYDPLEFLGIMAMSFDLCLCTLFCLLCIYHITSAIKCALEINKNNN